MGRRRMGRRILGIISAVVAVCIIGAALAGLIVTRGGAITPTSALGAPTFVDETATSGVSQVNDGGDAYVTGGGVAVLDCNGDGKPDMYIAGGTNPATLYRNDSPVGGALKFTNLNLSANTLTNPARGTNYGATNYLVLTVNTNNGVVTATFQATGARTNTIARGAALQNRTNALGAFPVATQTGSLILQ